MTGIIILSALTGIVGAFFGSVSQLPGNITGFISGSVVGYLFIIKMLSYKDLEKGYYKKGMRYGILAGLASGFITHIPGLIIENLKLVDKSGFIIHGWQLILIGPIFGIIVGFLFSFLMSYLVKKLHLHLV